MSVQSISERQMPRAQMEYYLRNRFSLDLKELDKYFTLYWSGAFFKKNNKSGVILKDNVIYIIVFHECTSLEAYKATQVQLSFRKAQKQYELPAYVLVRIAK